MLGAEVAAYLATNGYGTVNTNIFYNIVPADPDVLLSVMEYAGMPDEPDLGVAGKNTRLEYPRFQLIARGIRDDSDGPALKCIQARATLVAILNATLSSIRYVGVDALGPPTFLMRDENFRVYWVCNFQVIKVPSTS